MEKEERKARQGNSNSLRGGEGKRRGSNIGAAKTSEEYAEWLRLLQKSLNAEGLPKRKG